MRIAIGCCPKCHGDLYVDYKANRPDGGCWKCLECSRVYFKPLESTAIYRSVMARVDGQS